MIKVTEVTIISGFLGAGKTTLIKKLLKEVYDDEQVVLIENEFGEIGIDGGFLQDAGVEITEMNSGCICCSLSGDFAKALQQVLEQFHPDRIIIEPSGVGKLSDVKRAVLNVTGDLKLGSSCTVVDVQKCAMYSKNFGEFFNNQIEHADVLLLSRTQHADADLTQACVETLRALNAEAPIVTTPWDQLSREEITRAMMHTGVLRKELMEEEAVCEVCGHVHDHDHAHHHHDHHDHEEGDDAHAHHHHHHHHDHDADEVFTSWGRETMRVYTRAALEEIVHSLAQKADYGTILRAKGMVQGEGTWYYFDVTPQEYDIREGAPAYAGRYCVIGSQLKEDALTELFEGAHSADAETDDAAFTIEVD